MLSHGQVTMERGFSVNKQVPGENLSRESLRAQRLISDTMRKAGGPLEIIINEMMTYACSARHKYHAYLDKKRAEEKDERKTKKERNRS
ncbi:hypothetical protein ACJMK2_036094 [Sinanodonta woodiana]|uniref:Uncharacterized protein n=1 Tax=Sinanodonta woodiana TaxID=1069815 RepID=A0ABD3WG54_SINWO